MSKVLTQPYCRVYNFSPGPCTLPVEVLEEARDGLLNWHDAGMSVMEMSQRGKAFEGILAEAKADLSALLGIPDNYHILFLQGGASMQNTMVPMNFLLKGQTADYVVTGAWGNCPIFRAGRICTGQGHPHRQSRPQHVQLDGGPSGVMTRPWGPVGIGMVLMTWLRPVSMTATVLSPKSPT